MDTGIKDEVKPMNMEEFFERVVDGEMKPSDVPVLALIILCALAVIIGEVGCVIWFFGILISAMCVGAARLLMLNSLCGHILCSLGCHLFHRHKVGYLTYSFRLGTYQKKGGYR